MLLDAMRSVAAGGEAPHVVRDPAANDFRHLVVLSKVFPAGADWRACWQDAAATQTVAARA